MDNFLASDRASVLDIDFDIKLLDFGFLGIRREFGRGQIMFDFMGPVFIFIDIDNVPCELRMGPTITKAVGNILLIPFFGSCWIIGIPIFITGLIVTITVVDVFLIVDTKVCPVIGLSTLLNFIGEVRALFALGLFRCRNQISVLVLLILGTVAPKSAIGFVILVRRTRLGVIAEVLPSRICS